MASEVLRVVMEREYQRLDTESFCAADYVEVDTPVQVDVREGRASTESEDELAIRRHCTWRWEAWHSSFNRDHGPLIQIEIVDGDENILPLLLKHLGSWQAYRTFSGGMAVIQLDP